MTYDDDGVVVNTYAPMLKSSYNYDKDAASLKSGLACTDPTRAQQQFKEECDINTIIDRFGLGGEIPQNVRVPLTSEFMETMDYQESLNKLHEARDAFMAFPAKIREQFGNDAGKFVEFVSDPANLEKCREWNLAPAKAKEPEIPVVKIWADPDTR